jgi:hypothetical protein
MALMLCNYSSRYSIKLCKKLTNNNLSAFIHKDTVFIAICDLLRIFNIKIFDWFCYIFLDNCIFTVYNFHLKQCNKAAAYIAILRL